MGSAVGFGILLLVISVWCCLIWLRLWWLSFHFFKTGMDNIAHTPDNTWRKSDRYMVVSIAFIVLAALFFGVGMDILN